MLVCVFSNASVSLTDAVSDQVPLMLVEWSTGSCRLRGLRHVHKQLLWGHERVPLVTDAPSFVAFDTLSVFSHRFIKSHIFQNVPTSVALNISVQANWHRELCRGQ